MTGSPTYHQPSHLNEHDELQLEYMFQCAQTVSIERIQTMAGRLAVGPYTDTQIINNIYLGFIPIEL